VASFTSQLLYLQGKSPGTPWIGGWVGTRAGLDVVVKKSIIAHAKLVISVNLSNITVLHSGQIKHT
jgi:hypothetical protein